MITDEERINFYLNDLNFLNIPKDNSERIRYVFNLKKQSLKRDYDKSMLNFKEPTHEFSLETLPIYLKDCKRIINHSKLNKTFEFYFLDNDEFINLNSYNAVFVKCRHKDDNKNIIVSLNTRRHWQCVSQINQIRSSAWESKKKELVWRGADTGKGFSNDRLKFVEKYYKKYNVGFSEYVQNFNNPQLSNYYKNDFLKSHLNLTQITSFKYILILEGNDKSSSLNWALNSNCVPLMKKPTWHSWLCEPFLIPNYHYIELKDDFSDVEEKLQWLRENDDKAKEIAYNGIKYIETNFSNLKREFHLERKIVEIIEPYLSD